MLPAAFALAPHSTWGQLCKTGQVQELLGSIDSGLIRVWCALVPNSVTLSPHPCTPIYIPASATQEPGLQCAASLLSPSPMRAGS